MIRDIIIVGAGGFGREAAWTLERINEEAPAWRILGFADDNPALVSGSVDGYPLLGVPEKASHDHPGAAVFVALGDNSLRESVYRRLRGHNFPTLIDPSAEVAPTAEIRHGAFVGPRAVISVGADLGKFVVVNARAGVGHDSRLGDFSQVCPGATLSGHAVLGEHAYVASNACVAPGVEVGARAKIAAGMPAYVNVGDGETLSPFGLFRR
jgi:sugar O-acyltransferase (sialic acid O-acetyltransferase NeuD family)